MYIGYVYIGIWWKKWADFTRNVAIFDVDNSSSSHNNSCKDNFLVLGEGDTFGINRNFGATEKRFSFNFSEPIRQIFAWVCIIMVITVVCLLTGKKSISLKQMIKCQLSILILSRKLI